MERALKIIGRAITATAIILLIAGLIFNRYYIAETPDKSNIIIPIRLSDLTEGNVAEFLDGLEEKIPPLQINEDEFNKDTMF